TSLVMIVKPYPIAKALLVTAAFSGNSLASADVVTAWNAAALRVIRADNTAPPVASRALAILHVSIYDAVNGIDRAYAPYFVQSAGPASASRQAAASAAAHDALVAMFPTHATSFDVLDTAILAAIPDSPQKSAGVAWGEVVARQILVRRASDGADVA